MVVAFWIMCSNVAMDCFASLKRRIDGNLWKTDEKEVYGIGNAYFDLAGNTPPADLFPRDLEKHLENWVDGLPFDHFLTVRRYIQEGGWKTDEAKLDEIGWELKRLADKTQPRELLPQELIGPIEIWLTANEDGEVASDVQRGGRMTPESGSLSPVVLDAEMDRDRGGEEDFLTRTHPLTHFYDLAGPRRSVVRKFGVIGKEYILRFKNEGDMDDVEHILLSVFTIVIDDAFGEGDPDDLVGIQFHHTALDRGVFSCPFRARDQLTAEKITELLMKILQSKKEIGLDGDLKITATRIRIPVGSGFSQANVIWNLAEWLKKKHSNGKCIIEIKNKEDNLCFARACVVAKAQIDKETDNEIKKKWYQIRKGDFRSRYTIQKTMAVKLMKDAGLRNHWGSCGMDQFQKVQDFLEPEYQIKIFSSSVCNMIIFAGKTTSDKVLNLYLHKGHFSVISSMPGFINNSYWCDGCNKGVKDLSKHRCAAKCNGCFGPGKCAMGEEHYCNDCNRRFNSKECYQRHLTSPNYKKKDGEKRQKIDDPACIRVRRCKDCGRTLNMERYTLDSMGNPLHNCGYYFCRRCSIWTKNSEEHYCYIQPISKDKKKKKLTEEELEEREGGNMNDEDALVRWHERQQDGEDPDERGEEDLEENVTYVFWDFETFQEREVGENEYGPIFAHDPTCCVVMKVCSECKDKVLRKEKDIGCKSCGPHEKIFLGKDCRDQFCKWLFTPNNRDVTAIAHNAKGFDSQFLIDYLVKQTIIPKIIPRGLEIMAIIIKKFKIRIIDSLNFLPMALSALPKAFNIAELKKGFFPFKFFTSGNWNYVGAWPDAWFYDPAGMGEKKREEFYEWYHRQLDKTFDLQKELLEYCRSDVDILMRCCLQFEDEFRETTGVRPLQVATTIASACNYVFRRNFLKPFTIGLIPYGGYRRRERQSAQALRWLKWLSESKDIKIRHARNGGEKKIGKYKLDGYVEINGVGKGYEFYGCVFHGCERCFPNNREKKVPGSSLSLEDAYERTLRRAKTIRDSGIELVEVWECDVKKELAENSEMKSYFKSCDVKDPLDPRMAFFGGRTNSHYLYYEAKEGEKIHYVDVMSLYPFVNKWTRYPIGHPQIITEGFAKLTRGHQPYFGLIYCKVQPPKDLEVPVLPTKFEKKLHFVLCRVCMEEKAQRSCSHRREDRSLTGVWCSIEIDEALDEGYEVEEVYEVWNYLESAQFDGKDENTGLFTGYMNKFSKHKVEASGWPPGTDQSEETKKEFLAQFREREGVELDGNNMKKNSGIRSQSKLCLNSFWGKFGQRSNLMNGEFYKDPSQFMKLVSDSSNIIHQVLPLGGEDAEMIYVTHTKEEEFVDVLPNTNVVLAAFTTAAARLKLYSYLKKLGGVRILYMDTDSIIYVTRPGDTYEPPTGCFLGDMTDELADYGEGAYIDLFIGAGPKNYSFRVRKSDGTTDSVVKIRGFSLNHTTAKTLNLDLMKRKVMEFLRDGVSEPTRIVAPRLERRADREVLTTVRRKDYRIVYDKRRVMRDGSTLPYGYCGR